MAKLNKLKSLEDTINQIKIENSSMLKQSTIPENFDPECFISDQIKTNALIIAALDQILEIANEKPNNLKCICYDKFTQNTEETPNKLLETPIPIVEKVKRPLPPPPPCPQNVYITEGTQRVIKK